MSYAPGTTLHFFSDFKTVLCQNFDKLQIIKDISKSTKGGGCQTYNRVWRSSLQKTLAVGRQAVGCGGKVGSSIWKTCSFNYDTEQWELEWPEEKTGMFKRSEEKFLFPCFANMRKGGVSEKVNSIIKKCA
eukprot:14977306-Ditylum_brightwellii.AAC.1